MSTDLFLVIIMLTATAWLINSIYVLMDAMLGIENRHTKVFQFLSFFSIIAICVECGICNRLFNQEYMKQSCSIESTTQIYALTDDLGITGSSSYYIRTRIEDVDYIKYICFGPNGGKIISKVPANNSEFFETDQLYRVETCVILSSRKFWFVVDEKVENEYRFYVPEGTITNEFVVDMNE